MITLRCTWRTGHAQCEATDDLDTFDPPAPSSAPRLLCPRHLVEARRAARRRFRRDGDELTISTPIAGGFSEASFALLRRID